MTPSLLIQRRLDLHNTSINFAAAVAGQCGFTHVSSGRVCRLPHRHPGPCELCYLPRLPDDGGSGHVSTSCRHDKESSWRV